MADKQDKPGLPAHVNTNMFNTGIFGVAIPMPFPVFPPQVMPFRMIPPIWSTNNAFMQQYMEAMSAGIARPFTMPATTNTKEEPGKSGLSKGSDTLPEASAVLANSDTESTGFQSTTGGNASIADQSSKTDVLLSWFNNSFFVPFGGLFPYGSYFPSFDMPVSGLASSPTKADTPDSFSPDEMQSKDVVRNHIKTEKQEEKYQEMQSEIDITQDKCMETNPKFPSVDESHQSQLESSNSCKKENEINSAEMDVAQILVNIMPAPVINGVKQNSAKGTESFSISDNPGCEMTGNVSRTTAGCELPMESHQLKILEECDSTEQYKSQIPVIPDNEITSNKSDHVESMEVLSVNSTVHQATTLWEKTQTQCNQTSVITYVKKELSSVPDKDDSFVDSVSSTDIKDPDAETDECYEESEENSIPTVDDLLKGELSNGKTTYKCEVCAQLFRSPLGLQKHLEFHTDDGQHYTCTICFQRFKEAKTLEEHIAMHMRKRPHKCKFCPKAFRDPGSLQKHVRVHTGEKPYKCTSCCQSFAEYSSLRKHMRVHTGEQPYRCQYCSKAFSISGNRQRHVLIHTGERPYKCSFCPKAFNNPSHLRRHVKNLHFKGEGTAGVVKDMISAIHAEISINKSEEGTDAMVDDSLETYNENGEDKMLSGNLICNA